MVLCQSALAVDDRKFGIATQALNGDGLAQIIQVAVAFAGENAIGKKNGIAYGDNVDGGLDGGPVAAAVRLDDVSNGTGSAPHRQSPNLPAITRIFLGAG